ncbi:MAG: hypothetical protein WAX04_06250 [Oscillospiraceae bacterium]
MKIMTVNEVMSHTGLQRGTIEQFRNELQKYQIIKNNESLNDRAVKVLEKAVKYKNAEQNTWSQVMQKSIQEEYSEELKLPFEWDSQVHLKHLIWMIQNNKVKVIGDTLDNPLEFHVIYDVIIRNFVELGEKYETYEGSFGCDGNPITTYKCEGEDYSYYVIGRLNRITGNEDIHVFYCDTVHFNIMKCSHVCGGSVDKGLLKELLSACWDANRL